MLFWEKESAEEVYLLLLSCEYILGIEVQARRIINSNDICWRQSSIQSGDLQTMCSYSHQLMESFYHTVYN